MCVYYTKWHILLTKWELQAVINCFWIKKVKVSLSITFIGWWAVFCVTQKLALCVVVGPKTSGNPSNLFVILQWPHPSQTMVYTLPWPAQVPSLSSFLVRQGLSWLGKDWATKSVSEEVQSEPERTRSRELVVGLSTWLVTPRQKKYLWGNIYFTAHSRLSDFWQFDFSTRGIKSHGPNMTLSLCTLNLISLGIAAGPRQSPKNHLTFSLLLLSPRWCLTSQAKFSAQCLYLTQQTQGIAMQDKQENLSSKAQEGGSKAY